MDQALPATADISPSEVVPVLRMIRNQQAMEHNGIKLGGPTFGLHIIVKDAYDTIDRVLAVCDGRFDQIVILDTGSTDGTYEYIESMYPGVELYRHEWQDDFAEARNAALAHLHTDWFAWLDADDVVTFETIAAWRERIQETAATAFLYPYHYSVTEEGQVVVLQYRERVMRQPRNWAWFGAIHEILVFNVHDHISLTPIVGGQEVVLSDPVVHRPSAKRGDPDRNWRILHRELDRSVSREYAMRTRLYLQREAMDRGQVEYSLMLHADLLRWNALSIGAGTPYYVYESLRHAGRAYASLEAAMPKVPERSLAEDAFQKAIETNVERNEARADYLGYLLDRRRYGPVGAILQELEEEPPNTTSTVDLSVYGTYVHAMRAWFALIQNRLPDALFHHLLSLDADVASPIVAGNDATLRRAIEMENLGIVYTEMRYAEPAQALRAELIRRRVFADVILSTDPRVGRFARGMYFHFTESSDTLYHDAPPAGTRRFLFADDWTGLPPIGYEDYFLIGSNLDGASIALDAIQDPWQEIVASSVGDAMRQARASAHEFVRVSFDADLVPGASVFSHEPDAAPLTLFVNQDRRLIGMLGRTEEIARFAYDEESIHVFDLSQVRIVPGESTGRSVRYQLKVPTSPGLNVAIVAPGIEEWDGLTPHRRGIGASESSVVYLAEELVKLGHTVTVYCPRPGKSIVGGVMYLPTHVQHDLDGWDLLIASRLPAQLSGRRRARRQVLWMHDVVENYGEVALAVEKNVDLYVCVSDWQRKEAKKAGYPPHKLVVVPNGIHGAPVPYSDRKTPYVWTAQPERGLENLEAIHERVDLSGIKIAYGFDNLFAAGHPTDAFHKAHRYRRVAHRIGASIMGRLNAGDMRRLLGDANQLVYPSAFPETQCVSVVEALHAGVQCFVAGNGATADTARAATRDQNQVVTPSGDVPYAASQVGQWSVRITVTPHIETETEGVTPELYWPEIARRWIAEVAPSL